MPSRREADLFRQLYELRYGKADVHDVATACRSYLRTAQRLFAADTACLGGPPALRAAAGSSAGS